MSCVLNILFHLGGASSTPDNYKSKQNNEPVELWVNDIKVYFEKDEKQNNDLFFNVILTGAQRKKGNLYK
ncbi:uncharacterized protein METZ01_LOCUS373329 [marine metagenome]|uniref:Uncharacterized protein n=1 Tax=marine metagenome TaxID=408172 RepID=A0A382TFC4_9ZZZZ